jgi:hypothetical protein
VFCRIDQCVKCGYKKGNSGNFCLKSYYPYKAKKLHIAPCGGTTNKKRLFKVVLRPDGISKTVSYTGQPVNITF